LSSIGVVIEAEHRTVALTSTEALIQDTLFWHLGLLSLSPPLPVAYDGVPFTPSAGTPYLRGSFHAQPVRRLFTDTGAECDRTGFLQVSVFVAPGDLADVAARDIGAKVLDHFSEDRTIQRGAGPRVRPTRRGDVNPGYADRGWWHVPCSVYWQCLDA
jgi:hypothetical protein